MQRRDEVFGRYVMLERLAIGGMAEIFLVEAPHLPEAQRTCVMKRVLPEYSRDATFVSMFIDEARITIGLEHPNIVRLFDFGQVDGVYYMAMEYVDGTDLSAVLRAHLQLGKPLPVEFCAFVARELLLGLSHAHHLRDHHGRPMGIVHRDISPQNVLISQDGHIKLADFGIAAARHKLTFTSPGTVLGKAAYMSPEQATGKPVDFRTDLWAMGVMLHEMLTCERLFADDSPMETVRRVLNDVIKPPSRRNKAVPPTLDWIVMRALERNIHKRFASADAMAAELTAFLELVAREEKRPTVFGAADLSAHLQSLEWSGGSMPMRGTGAKFIARGRARPISGELASAPSGDVVTVPPSQASKNEATAVSRKNIAALRKPTAPSHQSEDAKSHSGSLPRSNDAKIAGLISDLSRHADPWTVVALGERYAQLADVDSAASAFRIAAGVFAFRGLLVQALCAYDACKGLLAPDEIEADLMFLGELQPGSVAELEALMKRLDHHGLWRGLRPILQGDLDVFETVPPPKTPLLSALTPKAFKRLGMLARVRRVEPSTVIIAEGEVGDTLYAIGKGRVVVHCQRVKDEEPAVADVDSTATPSADVTTQLPINLAASSQDSSRVYLAALSDGDFFGEFSFLTERKRSASVEAIAPCILLEIDRKSVKKLIEGDGAFQRPLIEFYKERVLELLMAKSPVFSLLEPPDRLMLLRTSTLEEYGDNGVIVQEGTRNDALFFIKRGEVEVFRTDPMGLPIFINKLVPGQFFGEIAALHGTSRTVSVRAMGSVELFRIERRALMEIVDREPRLKERIENTIQKRTEEVKARVLEHERVFFGS